MGILQGQQINVNKLTFKPESKNIKHLTECAAAQLTAPEIQPLRDRVGFCLGRLQDIQQNINVVKNARARLRNLYEKTGGKGHFPRDAKAFIQHMADKKYNIRGQMTSASAVERAYEELQRVHDQEILRGQLLEAMNIIKEVRNKFKTPINYGISFYSESNGTQQLWFSAHATIEEVLGAHGPGVMSRGALQLEYSTTQLREIVKTIETDPTQNKYVNLLESNESQQLWSLLSSVKHVINNKGISYSYGQLVEAFVALSKDGNYTPKTDAVFMALTQGRNTLSFEKEGDFTMFENNLNVELDFQSKLFSVLDNQKEFQHRIRLISISNAVRVLREIKLALDSSVNINTINKNLEAVFTAKLGEGANPWTDLNIEKKIKECIAMELKKLTQ